MAKGETRYVPSTWKSPPSSASLETQMRGNEKVSDETKPGVKYKVRKGDSLWRLAKHFYGKGTAYHRIAKANDLSPQKPIQIGTWLSIFLPTEVQTEKNKTGSNREQTSTIPITPRPRVNLAFAPGEKLKFEVRALSVLGGYATLKVGGPVTVEGRPCLSLTALANSAFPFSMVYPVKDIQTSYFDAVDFVTWKFENHVLEGGYKAHNVELYHQLTRQLERRHNDDAPTTLTIPPFTQDIISCFYYFRLLDLKVGGRYSIPTSSGGKNYDLIINVLDREKVTVPAGTFDCYKVKPLVKYGTVFRNKNGIVLWVTTDARHLPVRVESAIGIGTISITLLDATLPKMPDQ